MVSKVNQAELKDKGLKVTVPRMRILALFQKAAMSDQRHLTADDVFSMLKDEGGDAVGLATVYRVLSQFEVAGLIRRHHFDAETASYELGEPDHHDHLVCVKCGHVEEFIDIDIERRQKEIADRYGFQLAHHTLCLYGVCKKCLAEGKK